MPTLFTNKPPTNSVELQSVVTAAVWLVFTVGGVAGLSLQYQQAQPRAREQPSMIAQRMDVRLIGTPGESATANASAQAVDGSVVPPAMPAISPVLAPSPEIPFALPVNAPLQKARVGVPIEHLVLGVGEGDKPPPEYPPEARLAHQEGSVVIEFTIDENGHVSEAHVASPSRYALLNEAALRQVRDVWDNFPKGKVRLKDILFEFELHQH